MLTASRPTELQARPQLDDFESPGPVRRPGPALHVKVDGHRVVERRAWEIKRLHQQFNGVVSRPSRFQDEAVTPWLDTAYVPAQQRWCPRLERDVKAICSEAGLSRAATASILSASCHGTISQNPGVLLSRLLRFLDCLSPPLGRRGVLSVLRTAPSLLRYSPESLRWNVDMLAALLPDNTVAAAITRAPMLLPASAITLWGNFEGLRQLLRLDHESTTRVVLRAPRLLLNSRGALENRLADLAILSGAPLRRVAAVVARQPALLGYFPGTLERNLRHAADVLGVPFSRVQVLLLKQPGLVMLSRDTFSERVSELQAALGLHDAADLAAVVLRQPGVLTLAPQAVRGKVAVVARVLGLSEEEGGEAGSQAGLQVAGSSGSGSSSNSSGSSRRKRSGQGGREGDESGKEEPSHEALRRQEALRGVLRGAPQILTLASDSVAAKAAQLAAAVAPCEELRMQLQRSPPMTVAVWLCMSARRYQYVRAVAEVEAAAAAAEAGLAAAEAYGGGGGGGERVVAAAQQQQRARLSLHALMRAAPGTSVADGGAKEQAAAGGGGAAAGLKAV
ncbi:hypothetical protein Agub_g13738, partial [Astrephomene gubernaculifera]